jgi:uncharacterized membrane protein
VADKRHKTPGSRKSGVPRCRLSSCLKRRRGEGLKRLQACRQEEIQRSWWRPPRAPRKTDLFQSLRQGALAVDRTSFGTLAGTITVWGVSSFVQKLAANRLGAQSAFWHALAYVSVVILFSLTVFKFGPLMRSTPSGASLALLGGALSSLGLIGTYLLLTRTEASRAVPLTALYRALTSLLAILLLHECRDPWKLLGIAPSLASIYLLTH